MPAKPFPDEEELRRRSAWYRRTWPTIPLSAEVHFQSALVLKALGHLAEAEEAYRRAISLQPDLVEAQNNLGLLLHQSQRLAEAEQLFHDAIAQRPELPQLHNNLGEIRLSQGRVPAAKACFERALALAPQYAEAHNNLGIALQELGEWSAAKSHGMAACELAPMQPAVHLNLANSLCCLGEWEPAAEAYRRSLQLRPNAAIVHKQLGNLWERLGQHQAAMECYRQALACQPDSAEIAALLVHQMQQLGVWTGLEELASQLIEAVELEPAVPRGDFVSPFHFMALPLPTTPIQQYRCSQRWLQRPALQHRGELWRQARHHDVHTSERSRKLRVGYLSGDFHGHATSWLITGLIEQHSRERWEVYGYSYGPEDHTWWRQRIVAAFDHFRDLRQASHYQAASIIAADRLDLLVDLKGYTYAARPEILAWRPAPLQLHYLGYPGTMAADFIDYLVVDDFIVPEAARAGYGEQLLFLPDCYQVNDGTLTASPSLNSRGAHGLPTEGIVFCCFNSSYKINPPIFDCWMRLLQAIPGSVLWLLESNPWIAANLRREAAARQVAPSRLVFAPKVDWPAHIARQRHADLFLDCFPVSAHTTASDALRVGLPMVTLVGEALASRVAGSLLRSLGREGWIAKNYYEYEKIAYQLAREPDRLRRTRRELEQAVRCSPLFDSQAFAAKLETAYLAIYQRWQAGEPPRTLHP
jgi:predicted O-linked N-acetylglucosamine transferase (SPINDLY family)